MIKRNINPVVVLRDLLNRGADLEKMKNAMNDFYAVVKFGGKTAVASIVGKELDIMRDGDFHKMLANLTVNQKTKRGTCVVSVSKAWWTWDCRRQFVNSGVVFEPGGPPEIRDDMLNLWRGYAIEKKQGDWSLMKNHIREVICSGNEEHFQYLIRWMAYGVQYPDRPVGVAVALRGEEGAGKGIVWRNYGKLFGKHFRHVAQGEHLTGRFNAVLAETCAVFLDEALWAGDRKGEQILKALITEDTFQLERKNYDPIPVKNRLRIMIASNNEWIVPVGTKGRRYFVLDVKDKHADQNSEEHKKYWDPLHAKFGDHSSDDGRAAMLYDLLDMDLSGFNVLAVPRSAAKTEQKLRSLRGTREWLYEILQEGAIGNDHWKQSGLTVGKANAYSHYQEFCKQRNERYLEGKDLWSRTINKVLGPLVNETRPTIAGNRVRSFSFAPLSECRQQFGLHIGDPDLVWEKQDDEPIASRAAMNTSEDVGEPTDFDTSLGTSALRDGDEKHDSKQPPKNKLEEALERGLEQAQADHELVRRRTGTK
jgi:hypothetical protein